MEYSGRTTSHSHKFDDWKERKGSDNPAIKQVTLFDVQWSDCPVEVEEEVKKMWGDFGLGNDRFYFDWGDAEVASRYPIINEYLKSKGVTKCLIHWWW